MRTLKKVLCLVLSLSLVCSLAAVGVGASAFTDDAQIKYKEAVDVLVDLGVINGKEAGQFDPKGNLTRAEASKILAYMMLGAKSAEALPAQAVFTDVPATFWASKYIGYAVNEGYVNGNGDGTFDPDGQLTAYQWAKMLLCALGYDAKIENFVGDAWAVNVAKKALDNDIDLFDGNEGADYNAPCTREEAVLYAFNTLQADLVDYDTKGTTVTVGGVEVVTGASKAEPVIGGNGYIKDDGIKQFAEKYFDKLRKTKTNDDFGAPGNEWYNGDTKNTIGSYANEADVTANDKIKIKDVYKELNLKNSTDFVVYVDGVEQSEDQTINNNSNSAKIGGVGVQTNVYYDDDDANNVIKVITYVNTYIGKITAVDTNDDDNRIVKVDGYEYETENFAKKDWVLYTVNKDTSDKTDAIQSMVAAEKKTGTVEKKVGTDTVVIDGTTYKLNPNGTTQHYIRDVNADDVVDFYLDSFGNVIKMETSDNNVTTDKLARVIGYKAADDIDDARAKLLLADGTTKTVTLNDDSETLTTDEVGKKIVSFKIDSDGKYELTKETTAVTSTTKLEKKTAKIGDIKTTNKTVYVVESTKTGKDSDYDVYTGYANAPEVKNAVIYTYANSDNEAVIVYIVAAENDVDNVTNSNLTYVAFDKDADINSVKDNDYYELNAVVDGKVTTLKVDKDEFNSRTQIKNESGAVTGTQTVIVAAKSYKTNSDGIVTSFTDATGDDALVTPAVTKVSVDNGSIQLGEDFKAYASDVKVIVMDSDDDYSIELIDIEDIVDDLDGDATTGEYSYIHYAFDTDEQEVTVVILIKN